MPPIQDTFVATAASATSRTFDKWNGVNDMQYYPIQAHARGGIGQVLATGAMAGKNLLETDRVERGKSCKSTVMGVSGMMSSFQTDESYFKYASREWEAGAEAAPVHPKPFVSTVRKTRLHDLPKGGLYSKWNGLSSYENDMRVLQNHMHVMDDVEARRVDGLMKDRWEREEKFRLMGNQTREMMYQRRLENEERRLEPHLESKASTMKSCTTAGLPFQFTDRIEFEKSPEYTLRKSKTSENHHAGRVYPPKAKTVYAIEPDVLADKRHDAKKRAEIAERQELEATMAELDAFADRLEVHMKNKAGGKKSSSSAGMK